MIFIFVSLFIFQISITSGFANPINLGFDSHNPISEIHAYDEIEGSSWVEVGLRRVLSRSEEGADCENLLSTESSAAKLLNYRIALQRVWGNRANLSPSDRQVTKQLLQDIQNALSGY